jgi:hypothetical protein
MKKGILAVLLAFIAIAILCSYAICQPKKNSIAINPNGFTGVGIFKLGTDTTILLTYIKPKVDSIRIIDNSDFYFYNFVKSKPDSIELYRMKFNSRNMQQLSNLSRNPNVKSFLLSHYDVSGYRINNLILKYYKGKLISVDFDIPQTEGDFSDAIKEKYGNPKITKTTKDFTCLYKLSGVERTITAETFYYTWKNGSITGVYIMRDKFKDDCERDFDLSMYYYQDNAELDKWEALHQNDVYDAKPKKNLKDL